MMTIWSKLRRLKGWCEQGLTGERYALLGLCIAAQAITLFMTWPLWQVRRHPPHLPLIDLPQLPFGWMLIASLVVMLVRPKLGFWLHLIGLLTSFVFDQFRTQPQFIALAILMWATVFDRGPAIVRWFVASLWLWAGLHKLLSPDWMGHRAWELVTALGIDPRYAGPFAVAVALTEVFLGVVALLRPRAAAVPCVLVHLGIVVFLSPLGLDWNFSVIPWNLCMAAVGCWTLRHAAPGWPRGIEAGAALVLLVMPVGFYTGHVDHGIAHVLYSDNLPRGLISDDQGWVEISGWGELRIPFPNERRLLRIYFRRTAAAGSKLHLADPRPWLPDQYLLQETGGRVIELTPHQFFDARIGAAAGIGLDSPRSVFALSQSGVRMLKRTPEGMIYAVEIPPECYDEQLLPLLGGLPNLEQLQLAGCPVRDEHLRHLRGLYKLVGIGLDGTEVTRLGLRSLVRLPRLVYIEFADRQLTAPGFPWAVDDGVPGDGGSLRPTEVPGGREPAW